METVIIPAPPMANMYSKGIPVFSFDSAVCVEFSTGDRVEFRVGVGTAVGAE